MKIVEITIKVEIPDEQFHQDFENEMRQNVHCIFKHCPYEYKVNSKILDDQEEQQT